MTYTGRHRNSQRKHIGSCERDSHDNYTSRRFQDMHSTNSPTQQIQRDNIQTHRSERFRENGDNQMYRGLERRDNYRNETSQLQHDFYSDNYNNRDMRICITTKDPANVRR